MKLEELQKLTDQKIAILWFWKEGKSTLGFLLKLWMKNITILDNNINIAKQEGINYILWDKYLENLWKYNLIIKSPWISPYNPKIIPYKSILTSQTQIFFDNYKWKVIWITWTKWKSTTSTLTYKILRYIWYNVKLVWNIGNPVLDEIDIFKKTTYDYVIFELSSYMLEWLKSNLFIWVINNIYNCHIDWHKWRQNYENAKKWVLNNSKYKLCNIELKTSLNNLNNILYFWNSWKYSFKNWLFYKNEQSILKDNKIALQWEHNRINICVVIWILDIIDNNNFNKNIISLSKILLYFSGLPHRLENIWTYNWIIFIDDAIATTPESTIAAIKTYDHNIWTIILWWQDSEFNFTNLVKILKKYRINNIVLFPDTWEKIFWDLSLYDYGTVFNLQWDYSPKILKTKSMKSAIDFAYNNTEMWKICLLSNAAASYSLWSWYIEKWNLFQTEVKNYYSK